MLKCMKSRPGSSASMVCFESASVVRMGTMPPLSPSTPQMPPRVATRHWRMICGREDRPGQSVPGGGRQAGRLRSAPRWAVSRTTLASTSDSPDLQRGASEVSSDGEKASAAWRRTLDGTERRVHDQEERGSDADLVDRAHGAPAAHGRRHATTFRHYICRRPANYIRCRRCTRH